MSNGNAADVTPQVLRTFASQLKQFNEKLGAESKKLRGQFKNLGSTWRDREHKRFAEEFEQTMRVINKFIESSQKHIPVLHKKAGKAQDYLDA